jgi:hypothetical protein
MIGNFKHGLYKHRTYYSWVNLRRRCDDLKNTDYVNYGARGISYPESWKNFQAFLEDLGVCPDGFTIDRIDTDKSYSKENCQWVSLKHNCNNKRNNKKITANGVTKNLIQWSESSGISTNTISGRLRLGWSEENAVSVPVRPLCRKS